MWHTGRCRGPKQRGTTEQRRVPVGAAGSLRRWLLPFPSGLHGDAEPPHLGRGPRGCHLPVPPDRVLS